MSSFLCSAAWFTEHDTLFRLVDATLQLSHVLDNVTFKLWLMHPSASESLAACAAQWVGSVFVTLPPHELIMPAPILPHAPPQARRSVSNIASTRLASPPLPPRHTEHEFGWFPSHHMSACCLTCVFITHLFLGIDNTQLLQVVCKPPGSIGFSPPCDDRNQPMFQQTIWPQLHARLFVFVEILGCTFQRIFVILTKVVCFAGQNSVATRSRVLQNAATDVRWNLSVGGRFVHTRAARWLGEESLLHTGEVRFPGSGVSRCVRRRRRGRRGGGRGRWAQAEGEWGDRFETHIREEEETKAGLNRSEPQIGVCNRGEGCERRFGGGREHS